MINILNKIFGPNWKTSTTGIVTVVAIAGAAAIQADNSLVSFLPDNAEKYIIGISKLIAVITGIIFALNVKDSNVTGGTIPQTTEAVERLHLKSIDNQEVGSNIFTNIWPSKKTERKK
jgi:hypothetical protein